MSMTLQLFASAARKHQYIEFNPALAGNPQRQSAPSVAVGAEPTAEFDSAAKLSLYLTIYIDILEAANNQDFPRMKLQISQFKSMLTSQLTDDFRKLLMIQKLGGQRADDMKNATRFHHEMVAIGGKILPLLNRYDGQQVDESSIAGLLEDLTEVGDILMAGV